MPYALDLNGEEVNLRAPSATSSGIKVKFDFTISAENQVALTLDFDLRQSLRKTGNSYMISPVIKPSNDADTTIVRGESEANVVCLYSEGSSADEDDGCDTAEGTAKVKSGAYVIPFVEAGNYFIRFFNEDELLCRWRRVCCQR